MKNTLATISELQTSKSESCVLLKSKDKKAKKPSKSLFSVNNAQSPSSQVSDTVFVLRQIITSIKNSPSPWKFAKEYVLQPVFKNDLFVVSFGLPALSATPRVLDAAPSVHSDASHWTYHGERTAVPRKRMLNAASYNYLGFVDLEYNTRNLLEHAVKQLPFANDEQGCNDKLEEVMKTELREFMSLEGCVLTPSGYAINLVAFPAMAASANKMQDDHSDDYTVFLMDSESHSSMFMGAFIASSSGRGKVIRFRHNDVDDLTSKLETIHGSDIIGHAKKNVWVTIEGLYSMDGTLPPLKDIVMLKRKYGFRIYIDEAHSFLAIGSGGRGVVEYFCENECSNSENVRMQDIDMLGGTISKSMSSVGGFVLSSGALEQYIEDRASEMRASRFSSIPTLSLIRSLQILRKPKLVAQRLAHLRSISNYVVNVLEAKGYRISATRGNPLVAIIFDSVDRVLRFLKVGREIGLICCGAAYPAAPRGAPRVRLSLTGAHTWDDIHKLLELIDQIALAIGVKGLRIGQGPSLDFSPKKQTVASSPVDEGDSVQHSDEIDSSILALCPPASRNESPEVNAIRAAGLSALSKFNLGAAGPRWMYGTFSKHLELEEVINSSITTSVIQTCISPGRSLEQIQTTLFTDTRVGIMSVIATTMEGLTRQRAKNGEKHLILLPKSSGLEIKEAASATQPDRSKYIRWYETSGEKRNDSEDNLLRILTDEFTRADKTHLTMYLESSLLTQSDGTVESERNLAQTFIKHLSALNIFNNQHPLSMSLIINDPLVFNSKFVSTRALISAVKTIFPTLFSISSPIRFLLFCSFKTLPYLPGLQGAFCTGSKYLVEKVQFLGQGVMYTAMMPPLNAALAEETIKTILKS